MRLSYPLVAAALTTVLLSGCGGSDDSISSDNADHYTLHTGTSTVSSDGQKTLRVMDNSYDYIAVLDDYSTDSAATLDFSDYQVVLIDLGLRTSSGYAIRLDKAEEHDDYVRIRFTTLIPAAGCTAYSSAYTNPYIFEAVETGKEILFSEDQEENSCPQ